MAVNTAYFAPAAFAASIHWEVINADGLVPEVDIARLQEFGDEIKRRFSHPLREVQGKGDLIEMQLPSSHKINHIIIQEDIKYGERIRQYEVEGFIDGQWKSICKGESVGQKRIERFETVISDMLRLRIVQSVAKPIINNFSAYMID